MSRLILNNQTLLNETGGVVTVDSNISYPKGTILNTTFYENSTRVGVSTGATGTMWTFDVTKLYASTYSYLALYFMMNGHNDVSDNCGFYAHIAGSTTTSTDGTAYYDVTYTQNQSDNDPQMAHCRGKVFESLDAGTHTLVIGWSTRDGGTNNSPWVITNPNSSDDARCHQKSSTAVFYEIKS